MHILLLIYSRVYKYKYVLFMSMLLGKTSKENCFTLCNLLSIQQPQTLLTFHNLASYFTENIELI